MKCSSLSRPDDECAICATLHPVSLMHSKIEVSLKGINTDRNRTIKGIDSKNSEFVTLLMSEW